MRIIQTADGSPSIYSELFDQSYHSDHGAMQESNHIFIQNGLIPACISQNKVSIFEMGYGTGLNTALTWQYAIKNKIEIQYHAIELYPIPLTIIKDIIFQDSDLQRLISTIHQLSWKERHRLHYFDFTKYEEDILIFDTKNKYDVIYYDAFSPNSQPELWNETIFAKMFKFLNKKGRLITYCAKGEVKRTLKKVGFEVISLPGPKGKREITLAIKPT